MKSLRRSKKTGSRPRPFIYSNASIILFSLAVIFLSYQLIGLTGKRDRSEEKLSSTLATLDELEREKEDLASALSALETSEGKERTIRERFNVVKENEGVVYIIEKEGTEIPSIMPPETIEDERKESFLGKLWRWISL